MKPGSQEVKALAQAEQQAATQRRYALATKAVGFAESVIAGPGKHPEVEEPLLDLHWKMRDGALLVTRFPLEVWPTIREQIDEVYAALAEPVLHSPEGVDLAAEAAAAEQLRGGTQ